MPPDTPPSATPHDSDGYAPDVAGTSAGSIIRASSQPAVSPAEWSHERLVRQIADFERKLKPDEEVGGKMTAGPGDGAFQIEDVGWWGPDMIVFYGKTSSGRPLQLIQHYTQLNVLLTAVPKPSAEPARRIGFELASRLRPKAPAPPAAEAQRAESDSAA